MANSLVLDWLAENEQRAYPLKETINRQSSGSYYLTNDVILDAQLVYSSDPGTVQLTSIVVSGNNVTFNVTGSVQFVADKTQPFPQYLRLVSNHLLVVGEGITDITDGTYNFSSVTFEPSVVHEFYGPWFGVESISFDGETALTGTINLYEGFQFEIRIDEQELFLGANSIYGIPIGCEHFGDKPNNCDDIISFINGVQPDGNNHLQIIAGPGINVWDDPEHHRIYVGFNFTSADDLCKDIPPTPLT